MSYSCCQFQKKSLLPSSGQILVSLTCCIACSFSISIVLLSLLHSSAWLTGYEDPMIDKINQRIEDLTGLEMDTAEELQVKRSLWTFNPFFFFFDLIFFTRQNRIESTYFFKYTRKHVF